MFNFLKPRKRWQEPDSKNKPILEVYVSPGGRFLHADKQRDFGVNGWFGYDDELTVLTLMNTGMYYIIVKEHSRSYYFNEKELKPDLINWLKLKGVKHERV